MIEEKNFHDIRRNYVFSSIILILFLLYGEHLKLGDFAFLKLDGEWYHFSEYVDTLILLLLFFFYTFSRYCIYAFRFLNSNSLSKIQLFSFLNNLNQSKNVKSTEIKKGDKTFAIEGFGMSIDNSLDNFFNNGSRSFGIPLDKEELREFIPNNPIPLSRLKANSIKYNNDSVEFNFTSDRYNEGFDVVITFKKDVTKPIKLYSVFDRYYSDYTWPFLLTLIILFIGICKLTSYFLF